MSQDSAMQDDEGSVPPNLPSDPSRRFWIGATCAAGGVAGAGFAVPLVSTFQPSRRVPLLRLTLRQCSLVKCALSNGAANLSG